jgi:alkylhydroperoxidase/carboxymuconolactone decarboxylase family protein YurZ
MRNLAKGRLNNLARQLFMGMNNSTNLPILSTKSRKFASITALITSGEFEQLKNFLENCQQNSSISFADLEREILQITSYAGFANAYTAMKICRQVYKC